jgi:hypothetical protein
METAKTITRVEPRVSKKMTALWLTFLVLIRFALALSRQWLVAFDHYATGKPGSP